MKYALLLLPVAVLLATLRINGIRTEPFQITCHLYTGMLIGSYLASEKAIYFWLAMFLTVVEAIVFALK